MKRVYMMSGYDICTLFAKKFSSVFCEEELCEEHVANVANNAPLFGETFNTLTVDNNMIIETAARLKSLLNSGPDGIPSVLLKAHIVNLLVPISHVFNLSLNSGRFPAAWKTATIFPVHKKGDRKDVNNYRGISALCCISKLFELIVLKPILFHCKHYISEDQHGFVSGCSTATNLLCLTSHIADSFVDRAQTDVIYTELTAAFDNINHAITVAILFLLYFNDVNTVIKGPRLSYADNLKLFLRVRTIADAVALQHDLDVFVVWCDMNRLTDPEKCSIISFSRKLQPILFCYQLKGKVLQRVHDVEDLGVILDAQLTFKHYLSYVIEKASRTLGFIFRIAKDFTDPYCLKSLYCSSCAPGIYHCECSLQDVA